MYTTDSQLQGVCRFSVICSNKTALISFSVYNNFLSFPIKSNISSGYVSPENASAGITPCGFFFFDGKIKRQHNTAPVWLKHTGIPQGKKKSRHMSATASPLRPTPSPAWCLHASASNFKNNNNCKNISFSLPVMWPGLSSTWSDEELADVLLTKCIRWNAAHFCIIAHFPPELVQNLHRSPWAVSVTLPWGIWMLIPWHHFHVFSQVL